MILLSQPAKNITISVLLLVLPIFAFAQTALDGFDPNADGEAYVAVVQPDGKILIGGTFTALTPNGGTSVTRNRLARLNPNGTLDIAFNPNVEGGSRYIKSIVLQANDKILVAGDFTSVGGFPHNNLARLNSATGLPDSFSPNPNGAIFSIAVQSDGKILIGGLFTNIGGQNRNHIARLDPTTGLADSFNPNAVGSVVSEITLQADGKILVAGGFTNIGGQPRQNLARLNPLTGLADSFDPGPDFNVFSVAVQPDGKILAGGIFTTIGGQPRSGIARLDPESGLADSFDPLPTSDMLPPAINRIVVQRDGKILATGRFTNIGGQMRSGIARLDPATSLADSYNPNPNDLVYSMATQPDGKAVICGAFTNVRGETRNHIARLQIDGRLDRSLDLNLHGSGLDPGVYAISAQPDGKILIGGEFDLVLGVPRNGLARLQTDGTLDLDFNPNLNAGGFVGTIAVQSDAKILVGGGFTDVGGQPRNNIARIDAETGLADSFNPNPNSYVRSIAVQSDGRVLVSGSFQSIGGQQRSFARLDPTTGLADSFDPQPSSAPNSIAIQADGKIVVVGYFHGANSIGGQTRNCVARLDPISGLADSFDPNLTGSLVTSVLIQPDGRILIVGGFGPFFGGPPAKIARLNSDATFDLAFAPDVVDGHLDSMVVQADGKVLACGTFNHVNGQNRTDVVRFDAITGLPDSFNPTPNNRVHTIGVQSDGKILVSGDFVTINGAPRNLFARLSNDTAVQQDLSVSSMSVAWAVFGSAPQFHRVIFEYSADNQSYSFLGTGAPQGYTWILTGLDLPIGQNIYIRARGYYRGGLYTNSESIMETVRNVFLRSPTPTPTPGAFTSISGTVSNCTSNSSSGSAGVTVTVTGTASSTTMSDGSGNYTFASLPDGGNYAVTPTKAALPLGSTKVNSVDVIAVQRHVLQVGTPLAGCALIAANVNDDNAITTADVIAIQRFFIGYPFGGTGHVGQSQFTPLTRFYSSLTSNQSEQNFGMLVFGDVIVPLTE